MASTEEIVNFIIDGKAKTLQEIMNHFDESGYIIREKLRTAEIKGMIMRRVRNGVELWMA